MEHASEPKYNLERDIPEYYGYSKGKMTDNASIFVVYRQIDFGHSMSSPSSEAIIVDSTAVQDFPYTVRSIQGFDRAGLILFEHPRYGGNGQLFKETSLNITEEFPPGTPAGASSFLVYEGVWSLYLGPNCHGPKVTIDGCDEFAAGVKITSIGSYGGDQIRSVKKVRE